MARPFVTHTESKVTLCLNKQQTEHVSRLIKDGTWGNTPPQVAMRLFDKSLRKLIKKSNP